MPRNGSGVYSKPANTTAQANTTIRSAMFNSVMDDLAADANAPRPVSAGGTGVSTESAFRAAFDVDTKTVYSVKSGAYTAVANDNNGYFRYTASATLALAAAATLGADWHLTVHAYGAASVVIDPNSAELINGATTATIPPGSIATIICDGGAFWTRIDQEPAYSTKSAAYTAVLTDDENTIRFTAAATLTLTAAATLGSGWRCWVENSSAGNVIVDPNASQLINGALTLSIGPGRMAYIFCDGAAFWADLVDPLQGPQNQGFSYGLNVSNNVTDASNDIDIGIGSAAADTSPYYVMELLAARTKRIDAAWAVGNNAGGLDTGTVSASATYYIWLIQRSDTLVTDVLFSLSATAPTMPASYDRKRLIGNLIRASSVNASPNSALRASAFTSGQQTITLGSTVSVAHGLGAIPSIVQFDLICTTAQLGWSVGQVTQVPCGILQVSGVGAGLYGIGMEKTSTNITARFPISDIQVPNKTTNDGQAVAITPANWRLIVRALA